MILSLIKLSSKTKIGAPRSLIRAGLFTYNCDNIFGLLPLGPSDIYWWGADR